MPTPAPWYAAAQAALDREQGRTPYEAGVELHRTIERLTDEEVDAIVASIPPLPRTPEQREAIPDYGDLASSIIWYPVYAGYGPNQRIQCANCKQPFEGHDPDDGLCPSAW